MNPNPTNSQFEQTAVSGQSVKPQAEETAVNGRAVKPNGEETTFEQPTGMGGASDATVVRSPSSATVTDMGLTNTPLGTTSFGKYELMTEIARGGMGIVYRARQHGLDRVVALKMILGTGIDHEAAQRFLQEARAAAALDHPNVVPIYDIGEIGSKPYFTMAFIEGPNLRGFHDANNLTTIPAIVSTFAQIVAGVAHAHKHGIIHRDLKPANVLIDKDGRPRVTDFGLAKRHSADAQLTATGQVVGTPAYMPPEQARDSKDVGPPADVYSLGAILYFLLTGQAPFHAESVTDLLIKVVMEQPVPPRERRADIPPEIEELCLRCLAKSPKDRFADAQELLLALAPITDQYLTPSSNLTPSVAQFAIPRTPSKASTPSVPSVPGLPSTPTIPNGPRVSVSTGTDSVPSLSSALAARTTEPSEPKANRKPLFIAVAAVAVLAVGAAAFFATRGNDKTNTADPKKPAPEQPVVVAGDKLAWPAPTRGDFGLRVELSAVAATKDADGTIRMTAGVPMQITLKADRDCRASVWVIEPNGNTTRLFPNDDETDDRLVAGQERVVPGNKAYKLETTPTDGAGVERLRVFATTGEPPVFPPGAKQGRFSVYTAEAEREKLASTVRGIVIKKASATESTPSAVSEAELLFRVQK